MLHIIYPTHHPAVLCVKLYICMIFSKGNNDFVFEIIIDIPVWVTRWNLSYPVVQYLFICFILFYPKM
jgi:hypothetical protein